MTQRRRDTEDNEPIDIDEAHPPEVELVIFDRTEHGQIDDDERRERREREQRR